jgi:hypothetical protein
VDRDIYLLLLCSLIPWTRESVPFLKRLRVSSEERLLVSSCPPVLPLVAGRLPLEQNFVKLDIRNFYKNLSKTPIFG